MTTIVDSELPVKRKPGRPRKPPVVKIPKKRGKKHNPIYWPFDQAREFVRAEQIPSARKYQEWFKINKPRNLPAYPNRKYEKEWISWNDFLGNNNEFNNKGSWRDIDEATLWAHKLNLSGVEEWMVYVKDKTVLPDDIPARPDLTYSKWQSWAHFLGNRQRQALEAQQQAQKIHIYYIVNHPDVPHNVYTFGIETQGIVAFRERAQRDNLNVAGLFFYDGKSAPVIGQIIAGLSSPYYGDERLRIVPNIHEIIWHLQMHMDTARI